LPAIEPGSSIMPANVNPAQQEAMVMVCVQVIGEDDAAAFAGSQDNFELNAMRPIHHQQFPARRTASSAMPAKSSGISRSRPPASTASASTRRSAAR
jgi:hypothetical protein